MPENEIKPFFCKSCSREVARTDGIDLFFGVQKVPGEPLRVKFLCKCCLRPIEWHSSRKKNGLTLPAFSSNICGN